MRITQIGISKGICWEFSELHVIEAAVIHIGGFDPNLIWKILGARMLLSRETPMDLAERRCVISRHPEDNRAASEKLS